MTTRTGEVSAEGEVQTVQLLQHWRLPFSFSLLLLNLRWLLHPLSPQRRVFPTFTFSFSRQSQFSVCKVCAGKRCLRFSCCTSEDDFSCWNRAENSLKQSVFQFLFLCLKVNFICCFFHFRTDDTTKRTLIFFTHSNSAYLSKQTHYNFFPFQQLHASFAQIRWCFSAWIIFCLLFAHLFLFGLVKQAQLNQLVEVINSSKVLCHCLFVYLLSIQQVCLLCTTTGVVCRSSKCQPVKAHSCWCSIWHHFIVKSSTKFPFN